MKTKKLHIPIYEFYLVVFEIESKDDAEQLKKKIKAIGIPIESIKEDLIHIKEDHKNGGCTLYYKEHNLFCIILQPLSNDDNRRNTISHELSHVVFDICQACNIKDEEAMAYLTGWLNMKIF